MNKTVTLYRGINDKEFSLWKNKNFELLNNLSWWTLDLKIAQVFSTCAILKIEVNLDRNLEVDFMNGAQGQSPDYKGYGVNKNNENLYSFGKDYLFEHLVNIEILEGKDILPTEYMTKEEVLTLEGSHYVVLHEFNSIKNQKVYPNSTLNNLSKEEILEYMNKGYRVMSGMQDTIQLFKID